MFRKHLTIAEAEKKAAKIIAAAQSDAHWNARQSQIKTDDKRAREILKAAQAEARLIRKTLMV